MPPQNNAYQYIQIRDFRPGIADNPGANYPPGQAQRSFTYRCISNRAGALTPLPQGQQLPSNVPPGEAAVAAINGLYLPPITTSPTSGATVRFPPHEILVGDEILFSGQRFSRLWRFRRASSGNPADQIVGHVTADTAPPVGTPGGFHPVGISFGTTRSYRPNPNIPGVPVVIASWWHGPGNGYLVEFPDDVNTGAVAPFYIHLDDTWLASIACHQGRVVIDRISANNHGPNTVAIMSESISWSATSDVTPANFSSPDIVFVLENPSGLSFMHSMSANELFVVKQSVGGAYVSGDLNFATIVNLPLVTGCDLTITPVSSDAGVVYGSRSSGVWAWSHGDTCTLLSPQMDPLFWTLETTIGTGEDDFAGVAYQFARSDDWVLTPNNFLYDTQIKSWWRIEDPNIAQFRYMASNFRFIYGAHSWYTQQVPPPAGVLNAPIFFFDRVNPADSYSWQSQPLWETVDTLVDIREIALRVKGVGSVTIELRGESSAFVGPVSTTVTFSAPNPAIVRTPIRIQDSNIAVRLISTVSTGGTSAPTIYECNLGYITVQRERTLGGA